MQQQQQQKQQQQKQQHRRRPPRQGAAQHSTASAPAPARERERRSAVLPDPSRPTLVHAFEFWARAGADQHNATAEATACASDVVRRVQAALAAGWGAADNARLATAFAPPAVVYNLELFGNAHGRALSLERIFKVGLRGRDTPEMRRWCRASTKALATALHGWKALGGHGRSHHTSIARATCEEPHRVTLFVFSWHDETDPWTFDVTRRVLDECAGEFSLSSVTPLFRRCVIDAAPEYEPVARDIEDE